MFIDETEIVVSSGRGGDGMVSFRRERYVPKGGPDGGDGGAGGAVVLRATRSRNTLAGLQHGRHYRAENGRPGEPAKRSGRRGEDLVLELPVGTLVRDAERGHVLKDLDREDAEVVLLAGGAGGRGNASFASATNQVPRRATSGREGSTRRLRLELRLVADVGLVGLPNAGKSTFLRRVSAARPKVADYPFTTLEPVLGLVDLGDEALVLADIPGLIEGAHQGVGLGDRFLRHVQRTRVLLHLVDGALGPEGAVEAWRTVCRELSLAGLGLEARPMLTVVSRCDVLQDPAPVVAALEAAGAGTVLPLSSHTGRGVGEVLGRLRLLAARPDGHEPPAGQERGGGSRPAAGPPAG